MALAIISTRKNQDFLSKLIGNCSCDGPETGGLSGTMNKKPSLFVLEERPKTINPKTGELVYADQLDPQEKSLGLWGILI